MSVRRLEARVHQYHSFFGWVNLLLRSAPPHVSTISLPDITAHDQTSWAFPLCICVLHVIEDWSWERPGNEPKCTTLPKCWLGTFKPCVVLPQECHMSRILGVQCVGKVVKTMATSLTTTPTFAMVHVQLMGVECV